jgi:hypothetical protein
MKRSQRTRVIREWQAILAGLERRYVTRVFNAIKQQLSSFTSDMRTYGVEFARRRLDSIQFSQPMATTIRDMHQTAGLLMANRTLRALRAAGGAKRGLGFDQAWVDAILEYFRLHLLDSVDTINNTTRQHILSVLEEGFQKGWTVDEMAKEINNREYMKHRAALIVRTESVRAANYGVKVGAQTYEYEVVKEWVSIPDNRRRHSHALVDGQQREMNEQFSNGLDFPGDPQGPAKEVCNCRCNLVVEPVRDANGDLIPKRTISVIQPGQFVRPNQQVITV